MRQNSRLIACSIVVVSIAISMSGCGSDGTAPSTAETTTSSAANGPEEGVPDDDEAVPDEDERAALAGAVVFSMSDRFTRFEDGPGVLILAGVVQVGVLRPGDGLEIQGGGPDTGTTITAIRVGVPDVEVDSLSPGEFGYLVVTGEFGDYSFTEQLVRPID